MSKQHRGLRSFGKILAILSILGTAASLNVFGQSFSEIPATTVEGLLPATSYDFRAVARNDVGITYGTNQTYLTPSFLEVTNLTLLGAGVGSVDWGDYNNDGFLDLLVTSQGTTSSVARIYRNDGGTNLVDVAAGLKGNRGGKWGDYDSDGDLDLVLSEFNVARIYRNDGSNIFTDINASFSSAASFAWGDFDNDGDLDLVGAAGGGTAALLFRYDGFDMFTSVTNAIPQVYDGSLAWGDYDKDGDLDLLITGYNFGTGSVGEMTRLYRNMGRGVFTNSNISFQSVSRSSVAWGDYDNDGDLDILLSGSRFSNRYTQIYNNNGIGGFSSVSLSSVAKIDYGNVSWGDYDNDGDLDFLACGGSSTGAVVKVYRCDGGNTFRDSGAILPQLSSCRGTWGDFDNDGRLDIALHGYMGSTSVTKICRNTSLTTNSTPGVPDELTSFVANDSVALTWSTAFDANQLTNGLSYNLRVGTTPEFPETVGPMADVATGFRRVPGIGNVNLQRTWKLTNLVVGTYYWSVQTVDNSYAGSAFSTNGSFTVTTPLLPPRARTQPAIDISLNHAVLQGVVNARGSETTTFFQYGITTNFGNVTQAQSIGSGTTNVPCSATLTNLLDASTYYFRTVASNIHGEAFGATLSFTTVSQFSNIVVSLPTFGFGKAAWGDYDNDGDLDVALGGRDLSKTHIYRNDGGNTFVVAVTNLPAAISGGLDWGDYNSDGHLDLLIFGEPTMNMARNNGDGSFTVTATFSDGLFGYRIAGWIDFDNDADLDIFASDSNSGSGGVRRTRLYRNDSGTFVQCQAPEIPMLYSGSIGWADYDKDGDPDLAMSGQFTITNYFVPGTKVLRNDGNRKFVDIQAPLSTWGRAAWGDFDNDNEPDLLTVGGPSTLYENNNGSFVNANAGLPSSNGETGWIDYDNDGNLDLHLTSLLYTSAFYYTNRIYRNEGDGRFSDSRKFFLGSAYPNAPIASIAWGDYDGDGDLDVLVNSFLFRNNILVSNPPPAAPSGLTATRSGNLVTLQWNAPLDANQGGGLTYDVAIGTSPGNYNVISPRADATGWRRVVQPGVAASTVWKLTLPVATYYWRVQAIDHTLAGSPFSAESSFTVPLQAPAAITDFGTTNASSYPVLNGFVNPNGLATIAYFEYGVTNFEFRTPAQMLDNGTEWIVLSVTPTNLVPEANYSYRIVGTNSLGVGLGVTRTFRISQFSDQSTQALSLDSSTQPLAWADFDNDGDLDLLVGRWDVTSIYRNDTGILTFTNVIATFAPAMEGSAAIGDYDNDGRLDILMSGRNANFLRQTKLYQNLGSNQFAQVTLPLAGLYRSATAWADFDNDADLDFVVTGKDQSDLNRIYVCRNDGHNIFTIVQTALDPVYNGSIACGDYDSDGDMDVLMTGANGTNRLTRLYRNQGNFVFIGSASNFEALDLSLAHWGDCDNDGDLDILLNGNNGGEYRTLVYRNEGGTFAEAVTNFVAMSRPLTWFDYDNDGRLDIVAAGYGSPTRPMRLYHNLGDGEFADSGVTSQISAIANSFALRGDYDNDGDVDVLFGSQLLRNEYNTPNSTSSPPTGLSAGVLEDTVVLAWDAANDPNQAGGLSYNVRIGTAPGAGNILSGMSLTSGYRLLPELGNAYSRTNFALNGLNVGTYYWSVQAIDNSFAGSEFAPEVTFVVPPYLMIQSQSNANVLLTFVGEPDNNYEIQASDDLIQWNVITNFATTNGILSFSDPSPVTLARRFYRSMLGTNN